LNLIKLRKKEFNNFCKRILRVNELRRIWLAVHEARMEEMGTVHKISFEKSQGKCTTAPCVVLGGNIGMVLKILHHEVSYTYEIECGSPLLQTEGKQ
jgi:hypothetical protein